MVLHVFADVLGAIVSFVSRSWFDAAVKPVYDGTSARHPPAPVHRVARRGGGAALWVTAAATLVFLYLGATMPIFGAEINGVPREKT